MPLVRLLRGTFNPADGERAGPGDTIELDEETIARLPEAKFELVESADDSNDVNPDTIAEGGDTEPSIEESDADAEISEEIDDDVTAVSEEMSADDEESVEVASVEDIIPYDDYNLLSKMAMHYDGSEIHGAMSREDITDYLETLSASDVLELKRQGKSLIGGD